MYNEDDVNLEKKIGGGYQMIKKNICGPKSLKKKVKITQSQ